MRQCPQFDPHSPCDAPIPLQCGFLRLLTIQPLPASCAAFSAKPPFNPASGNPTCQIRCAIARMPHLDEHHWPVPKRFRPPRHRTIHPLSETGQPMPGRIPPPPQSSRAGPPPMATSPAHIPNHCCNTPIPATPKPTASPYNAHNAPGTPATGFGEEKPRQPPKYRHRRAISKEHPLPVQSPVHWRLRLTGIRNPTPAQDNLPSVLHPPLLPFRQPKASDTPSDALRNHRLPTTGRMTTETPKLAPAEGRIPKRKLQTRAGARKPAHATTLFHPATKPHPQQRHTTPQQPL